MVEPVAAVERDAPLRLGVSESAQYVFPRVGSVAWRLDAVVEGSHVGDHSDLGRVFLGSGENVGPKSGSLGFLLPKWSDGFLFQVVGDCRC